MGKNLTWIVTRAEPEVQRTVALLRNSRLEARPLPCIDRQWRPWPEWPRRSPTEQRLLFLTSTAVADAIPLGLDARVVALAPATAARARERRIPLEIEAHGGSVALARAVARWARDRELNPATLALRYPTSDLALAQPEHREAVAILSAHAAVEVIELYRTVAPTLLADALHMITASVDTSTCGIIFASPSAVEQFAAHGGFGVMRARSVVLIGDSTLRAWHARSAANWPQPIMHEQSDPLPLTLRRIEEQLQ
jgi:uroporphyrinogen-III synthase